MDSSDGHRHLAGQIAQLGQLLANAATKSGTGFIATDGFVGGGRYSVVAVVAHGDQFWTKAELGRPGRLTIRAGMPLLGHLFGPADTAPIVIPVATSIPVAFRVYYTPGYPPLLPDELRARASEWVETHVADPLRPALRPLLASLNYTDMAKTSFPPPLDALRSAAVGAEERSRVDSAWQVAVVACEAQPQVPMLGLWAAIAAGRSAAIELRGALFDAAAGRLTSIPSYQQPLAGGGVLRVADHAAFEVGSESEAAGTVRSRGMRKFGLPEVELAQAAGGRDLVLALELLAQQLLDRLLTANQGREEPVAELSLPPEVTIELPSGPTPVRLFLPTGRAGPATLVGILPL